MRIPDRHHAVLRARCIRVCTALGVSACHPQVPSLCSIGSTVKALLKAGSQEPSGGGRRGVAADIGVRMAAGVADLAPTDGTSRAQVDVAFTARSMPPQTYPLVVGADGVGSRVRDLCVGPVGSAVKVVYPGWGYWWSSVPAAVAVPWLNATAATPSAMVEVWQGDQRFGVARLPNSRALVWGTVGHARPQPKPKDAKMLARQFSDAFQHLARRPAEPSPHGSPSPAGHEHMAAILAHLRSGKSVVGFRYPATVVLEAGAAGYLSNPAPLALIGDAAHATHPALFQGCALALEDGYTLAHAVVREGGGGLLQGDALSCALKRWRRARQAKALVVHQVCCGVRGFGKCKGGHECIR